MITVEQAVRDVNTVTTRIAAWAARHPDRTAVEDAVGGRMSYAEVQRRSHAVAHRLRSLGAGPGCLVGVCLQRTPQLVPALLGVLESGAAYLPLDPAYPAARLRFMLEDSAAALVLSEGTLLSDLPAGITRLRLEDVDDGDVDARPTPADSDMYVIYTSGSTGQPKGVPIAHAPVANLLDAFAVIPGLSESDRVLAVTTLSFDIAVLEIWLPLVCGATVVLANRDTARDGPALRALIERSGVTWIQATPSTWRLLLDAGWQSGARVTALSGGEPLTRALADAILATGAQLWNVYGPTEAAVWTTISRVGPAPEPILVGRPIANTGVHVLDEHGQVAARGAVGELYISGAGVARGYLNREALTAEKFVMYPPGDPAPVRMYRTGDAGREHEDGQIECLGRLDNQFKIDGHRIEPGEIEAALTALGDVPQAVVAACEHSPGDWRIVAYLVPGAAAVPTLAELRGRLRDVLPAHMLPSAVVTVPDPPLTPTGKIDRRALPPPDWRRLPGAEPTAAPRTAAEIKLARLWCDVLGLPVVGIDDDFFDVGGRSRLGARLFALIEMEFGVRLPLVTLFDAPTVAQLAARIETATGAAEPWPCAVPLRTTGSLAPFFCVHPVGGNVVSFAPLALALGPDVPFYGIQSAGLDGIRRPVRSLEAMAALYIDEIVRLRPSGPYHVGGASFGGMVAYEMAVQLRAAGREVGVVALVDTDFPPCPANVVFRLLAKSNTFRLRVYPLAVRVRAHLRSWRRLGPRAYLSTVRGARPASASATPRRLDPFMRILADVEAGNRRAMESYLPRVYDGVVSYFRARDGHLPEDRRHLWRTLAPRTDVIDIPGTHFSSRREPRVRVLAKRLRARLRGRRRVTTDTGAPERGTPPQATGGSPAPDPRT